MFSFSEKIRLDANGSFTAAFDKVAYTNEHGQLVFESSIIGEQGGNVEFFDDGSKMILYDKAKGERFLVDLETNKFSKILDGYSPYIDTLDGGTIVISELKILKKDYKLYFHLGAVKDFEIHKSLDALTDFRIIARFSNHLVVRRKMSFDLLGYDLTTDDFTWKIDSVEDVPIKKLSEKKLIGYKMYVSVNMSLIAEIDIRNGSILRTWSNSYFQNPNYRLKLEERGTIVPFGGNNCLLLSNSRYGTLYDQGYRDINLKTGEVFHNYLHNYFKEERVVPFVGQKISAHDRLIYFSSQFFDAEKNRYEYSIGAFDVVDQVIASKYIIESDIDERGLKGPVVNDNQLFVCDYSGWLYVFDLV